MNNLILRAITGLLFVCSILASIWFNEYIALSLFSLFFFLGIFEFANLFQNHEKISFPKIAFIICSSIAFILVAWTIFFTKKPIFIFFIVPIPFILIITELWRNKANPIFNISVSLLGFFYLVFPFSLLLFLIKSSVHINFFLIGMFLLIWTNDTFAYFSGRILGKTKLFERVSPNKTWEGTIGGIVFTIIVATVIGFMNNDGHDLLFWIVSACIIAPAAIVGDLLESLIKRNLNIKDTGTILPGHGGILDRFDATLFTLPFFFSWVMLYGILF